LIIFPKNGDRAGEWRYESAGELLKFDRHTMPFQTPWSGAVHSGGPEAKWFFGVQ